MNKSAIEKFAQYARKTLIELVTQKARYYGITAKEIYSVESESSDAIVIHGTVHSKKIKQQREVLVKEVKAKGFEQVVEEVAYTWFNRFAALRFMEVNEYLPTGLRVFSSIEPDKDEPDLLTHALNVDLPGISKEEIFRFRDAHDDEGLYKYLLIAQCNALNRPLPFLFETISDYTELLFPDNMLASDSLLRRMVDVDDIPEDDWREIEIVGWLYQFYISEKKDQVIGKVVKKEDIPAATQLFTPKWIVQYMVENSLGRLWLEMHPDSTLRGKMQYYIENPDDKDIKREPMRPEEITCMDDACGSGHILVYMFDILYAIYEEMGYVGREIPSLILKNNLYGIDIDRRAVQLSSFALMMKARERDRQFFSRSILPHVIEIQESNGIDLGFLLKMDQKQWDQYRTKLKQQDMFDQQDQDDIFDWASEQSEKESLPSWIKSLQQLVEHFKDAKNYGSLLTIPIDIKDELHVIYETLGQINISDLFGETLHVLSEIVTQSTLLAKQYDVCVANPPYMGGKGMNNNFKDFASEHYPLSKWDTFSMFIERGFQYIKQDGFNALITMHSWMFLSSFEKFRQALLDRNTIISMAHLGPRAFDSISGEIVQTTAFVCRPNSNIDYMASYFRLISGRNENEKSSLLVNHSGLYWASVKDLKSITGMPIAYWLSENMRNAFKDALTLDKMSKIACGMTTGDNEKYLRLWHEVDFTLIGFNCESAKESKESGRKWFPYCKGGEQRKWYGNNAYVINWMNDGFEIKSDSRSFTRAKSLYFKENITWSDISGITFAARYTPPGSIFDVKGSCAFAEHEQLLLLLAIMNSALTPLFIEAINPTLTTQVGDISRIPLPHDIEAVKDRINALARQSISIAKLLWDSFETSWNFQSTSILTPNIKAETVSLSYGNWQKRHHAYNECLSDLEAKINEILSDSYGLSEDVPSKLARPNNSLSKCDFVTVAQSNISYAIGCIMGRYSIDAPGLIFAGGDWDSRWRQYETRRREMEDRRQQDVANGELLAIEEPYEIPEDCATWFHSPSFPEDDDGIIPLLADDYFPDDGTGRIVEFLRVTFGEKTLSENLQFLSENLLKSKGDESPTQVIRRYLCTQFFKDHCQTYKKRPIYWLFTSGPERAFQALIYMHRYTPSMLAKLRTEYLHELQGKVEIRINHLQSQSSTGTPKEQRDAAKQIANLHKQQEELRKYDGLLRHYADMQIEIDLDDGVKVNYAKFGPLLAPIPGLKQDED